MFIALSAGLRLFKSISVPFFALLLASCTGVTYIAIPPTLVPDPIHVSDSRLIQNPPDDILAQFTVDAEGYITDGPRSRPGEPVDHTALIANTVIAESFAKVALGNSEGSFIQYAHPDERRLSDSLKGKIVKYDRDLGQAIFYRGGIITGRVFDSLDRSVKRISKTTGLKISMQNGREFEESLGYFFVKDQQDMQKLADQFRGMVDRETFESEEYYSLRTLVKTLEFFVQEDIASCFGFSGTRDNGALSNALIVFYLNIPAEQLESCAYEEPIQAMGLFNDDDTLFNTLFTDAFKEYLFPTELDWMMLRILYDERIENGMTRDEAMPIVRQILTETRPYGD